MEIDYNLPASADSRYIRTKSDNLVFLTKVNTKELLVISNEWGERNGGRIECLPIELDDLVTLRNHLSTVILSLTLPT